MESVWSATRPIAEDFGFAVAAGDIDGDGHPDLLVGAPGTDAVAGRAYVYHGGPGADAHPDILLVGVAGSDRFGAAVACGDLDGDGRAESIVGAPGHAAGAGRVYVFDGDGSALVIDGASQDRLGHAVAVFGDVDGDGYHDWGVGAPGHDERRGRIDVRYGGNSLDSVVDRTLLGEARGDEMGLSLAAAGDVDGDGRPDVLVGAPFHASAGLAAGRAYVFTGGAALDGWPDLRVDPATAGAFFGFTVGGAGDVDGDGRADVLVGALHDSSAGPQAGAASLYLGRDFPDDVVDLVLTGEAPADIFGSAVAFVGDLDGDGLDDLAVGAPGHDAGGDTAGRLYVHLGASWGDGTADATITGHRSLDKLGRAVARVGDFDGDGTVDFMVGRRGGVAVWTLPQSVGLGDVPDSDPVPPAGEATRERVGTPLGAPHPNPARAGVLVRCSWSGAGHDAAWMQVYDVRGRRVARLRLVASSHGQARFLSWRTPSLPVGSYRATILRDGRQLGSFAWSVVR